MQKINISTKVYFISLIALVFVLGLSGCGKVEEYVVDEGKTGEEDVVVGGDDFGDGVVEEEGEDISDEYENILGQGILFDSQYWEEDIQEFLNTQKGILKRYTFIDKGQERTAADMINTASRGLMRSSSINPRVLLLLLELKKQDITNSGLIKEELSYLK